MFDRSGPSTVEVALHTDALGIEGRIRWEGGSLARLLSDAGEFLVLEDARIDEHASRGNPTSASFVRVRLADVRFALAELAPGTSAEAAPPTPVLLAVPPFVVTGRVGLADQAEDIRGVLAGLHSGFVEILGGAYLSEPLNMSQRRAPVIVVNLSHVQAMAPHREVDPWAGLAQARAAALDSGEVPDGPGAEVAADGDAGPVDGNGEAAPLGSVAGAPEVDEAGPGTGAQSSGGGAAWR